MRKLPGVHNYYCVIIIEEFFITLHDDSIVDTAGTIMHNVMALWEPILIIMSSIINNS